MGAILDVEKPLADSESDAACGRYQKCLLSFLTYNVADRLREHHTGTHPLAEKGEFRRERRVVEFSLTSAESLSRIDKTRKKISDYVVSLSDEETDNDSLKSTDEA